MSAWGLASVSTEDTFTGLGGVGVSEQCVLTLSVGSGARTRAVINYGVACEQMLLRCKVTCGARGGCLSFVLKSYCLPVCRRVS